MKLEFGNLLAKIYYYLNDLEYYIESVHPSTVKKPLTYDYDSIKKMLLQLFTYKNSRIIIASPERDTVITINISFRNEKWEIVYEKKQRVEIENLDLKSEATKKLDSFVSGAKQ